jgi:hypothetical protein
MERDKNSCGSLPNVAVKQPCFSHVLLFKGGMGKRASRRRKSGLTITRMDVASGCPHCGATVAEKRALGMVDALIRSQAELCAMLRLAGRQLLQFTNEDDQSLERIRVVLKRAENIHKTVTLSEPSTDVDERSEPLAVSVSGYIPDLALSEVPERLHKVQRKALTRPFAQAELKL